MCEGFGHRLQRTLYAIVWTSMFTLGMLGRKGTFFDLCCKKMALDTVFKIDSKPEEGGAR